jgi:hypothetical protein
MERFHLPKNYYKSVHPMVTVATITTIWGILPVLAFFPNSMDWIIPDPIDDYIEDFHYKLIKLWNVFLWVITNCAREILPFKGFINNADYFFARLI